MIIKRLHVMEKQWSDCLTDHFILNDKFLTMMLKNMVFVFAASSI